MSSQNCVSHVNFSLLLISVTLGTCDNPGIPNNVADNLMYDKKLFEFGTVLSFDCRSNFNLVGPSSIQCVLGRHPNETMWNSTAPVCEGTQEKSNILSFIHSNFIFELPFQTQTWQNLSCYLRISEISSYTI